MAKQKRNTENKVQENGKQPISNGGSANHFIAAIGASAGGLEAIHQLFDNMPQQDNLSFVVIQHLSPDYKSLLVELVSKHTRMKVYEAEQDMFVENGCIYIIPTKKVMTIADGHLQLFEKKADKTPNTAIDTFFTSLAHDQGPKAIAVVLSGTGTDGSRGIRDIKKHGGLVIVQEPESAKFDGMPRSAIDTGCADIVAAPQQIPVEIHNYTVEQPNNTAIFTEADNELLDEILQLINQETKYDFQYYKPPTLIRRITRRMLQGEHKQLKSYLDYLRETPEEVKALSQDFLIGVTRFFRDEKAYEFLEETVLPDIVNGKSDGDNIKVWVTACSTGEEAYSIAILLIEYLKKHKKHLNLKIFASDIDPNAIKKASQGSYLQPQLKDVPAKIKEEYFTQEGNIYTIVPYLRKQIIFARHNIVKDPPFINNDLVTCRNMLIYMSSVLQKKVLATLHFSLNDNGTLFLGSSETISSMKNNFDEINSKWKFYKKISQPGETHAIISSMGKHEIENRKLSSKKVSINTASDSINDALQEAIVAEYGYAAIYLDADMNIKETAGSFKNYISLPDKLTSLNIQKMVPSDLSVALSTGVRKALREKVTVNLKKVVVREGSSIRFLSLIVKPPANEGGHILVVIGENKGENGAFVLEKKQQIDGSDVVQNNQYIKELEADLKETRTNLKMAIESLETANEELQSSNEELLSANEELQSSNEELQSLNEELHTLNTEHQIKIRELIELNDDLNNYFRSSDIGQIFLDNDLRIRKFNAPAISFINLIDSDIGRPLEHISTKMKYENLSEHVGIVLREGTVIEKEVVLDSGKTCLVRILPFVRQDKQVDGVVITFVDISTVKNLNNIVTGVFNASLNAIFALKAVKNRHSQVTDFEVLTANKMTGELIHQNSEDLKGQLLKNVFPELHDDNIWEKLVTVADTGKQLHTELMLCEPNGREQWYEVMAVKMMDGIVLTLHNTSGKKEAEERLRRNYNELIVTKDKLKQLNAGLESKVLERTQELSDSEERFRQVSNATNDTVWDWDLVENAVWWSDNFTATFGYSKNQMPSNREEWVNLIHPEDREQVNNQIYEAINSNQRNWSVEYRISKVDGTYAQVLDRGYLIVDHHNIPYRMLGAMMDITDLRNAELNALKNFEEKNFLAESMPLMLWTANENGEVNFVNQQYEEFTGKDAKTGLGTGWFNILHPDDVDNLKKGWKQMLKTKKDLSQEVRLQRHDGSYRWHLLRCKNKPGDDGIKAMWLCTCTDVHEQKEASDLMEQRVEIRTKELKEANVALENSNNDLQQFASVASHDLKEPLRKILLFSKMAKDKAESGNTEQQQDFLERIVHSSTRMTKLVDDLLNYSRISTKVQFEKANLNVMISEIISDLELSVQEKNADIQVMDLPEIMVAPSQIRQVFQNIINNALKFCKQDVPCRIRVYSEFVKELSLDAPAQKKGAFVRIFIEDNGIGFDEQYLGKIFTIFQRLHTKYEYEGTGIGLAVTKRIIDKHNGLITAHSKPGEGATFVIMLPVIQSEQNEA